MENESDKYSVPFIILREQMNYLLGELLTITDASFSDKEQRKAVVSLIKTTVWRKINHLQTLSGATEEAAYVTNAAALRDINFDVIRIEAEE